MLKQQEALSTELWLATKWFLFCWYYFKNCSLLALALLFTRKDGHLQLVVMMQHAFMRNWSWDTYISLNSPFYQRSRAQNLKEYSIDYHQGPVGWSHDCVCGETGGLGGFSPYVKLPWCPPRVSGSSGQLDGQSRPSQIFANWFLKFNSPQELHCDVGQWPALHQHGLMGVCFIYYRNRQ